MLLSIKSFAPAGRLGSSSGRAGTASAVTERALSAPCGGTSPTGRGKALWRRDFLNQVNPPLPACFLLEFPLTILPSFGYNIS